MDSERKCKIKILVQAWAWLGRCLLWDPISGFIVGGPECWAEGPTPAWPVTRPRTRPAEDVAQSFQNQRRCPPVSPFLSSLPGPSGCVSRDPDVWHLAAAPDPSSRGPPPQPLSTQGPASFRADELGHFPSILSAVVGPTPTRCQDRRILMCRRTLLPSRPQISLIPNSLFPFVCEATCGGRVASSFSDSRAMFSPTLLLNRRHFNTEQVSDTQ